MTAWQRLVDQVRLEPLRWVGAAVAVAITAWFGAIALLFGIYVGVDPEFCGDGTWCLSDANLLGSLGMLLVGAGLHVGGIVVARIVLVLTPWTRWALLAILPTLATLGYLVYSYVA
ncbi:MAG: hypothetical protein KY469_03315 [Actinobacteria bacterium]|nr:hypothetical protein [Actinomycetota bacterium]